MEIIAAILYITYGFVRFMLDEFDMEMENLFGTELKVDLRGL